MFSSNAAGPASSFLTPPPSPESLELMNLSILNKQRLGGDGDGRAGFQDLPSPPTIFTNYDLGRFESPISPIARNSLPRINATINLSHTDYFRQRSTPKAGNNSTNLASSSLLRSPDRFLPTRSPLDTVFERYHVNKDSQNLSPSEKLLRRDIDNEDVFFPRRRATLPNILVPSPVISNTRRVHVGGSTAVAIRRDSTTIHGERPASLGSTWTVGGLAPPSFGIPNGRGGLTNSGTTAPLYTTSFSNGVSKAEEDRGNHEARLAKALELNRARRILECNNPTTFVPHFHGKRKYVDIQPRTIWGGNEWIREGSSIILDAPNLRDDFYCSVLAYSPTSHTLVVGLGTMLYAWSETRGVHLLHAGTTNSAWLTSIAFSSTQGQKCILAYGRSDGALSLMSIYDRPLPRFEIQQPCPIACISWRPVESVRLSQSPANSGTLVKIEDLIVGDESGNIYYYSVEWPKTFDANSVGWPGAMTLLARISVHTLQICGLAWSPDGSMLATGGNDNLCCLFNLDQILEPQSDHNQLENEAFHGNNGIQRVEVFLNAARVKTIYPGAEMHRWIHRAAVKAIAFCPWRAGLIATGGGSNDQCIHFFHAFSGACLATISVAAQVTSLIWSTTRREIVATFGYAEPEHPIRIAVFSWPQCTQVAAIPWEGEHRALYAIPYPGGPNESHHGRDCGNAMSRTAQEGCIVIAASDESVKFHEVWSAGRKATSGGEGLLGGSDILEGLEGNDREGEIIR